MKKMTMLLTLTAALVTLLTVAAPASAAIFTPGPQDVPSPPGNGFPRWYTEPAAPAADGRSLALCLSQTPSPTGLGPMCLLLAGPAPDPFNPANAIVFPTNFPEEAFYFIANARILDIGLGERVDYGVALEAVFSNGPVEAGQQITFARIGWGFTAPFAGTYRVTHPFGQRTFTNIAAGQDIRVQDDVGAGQPGGPFGPFNSTTPQIIDNLGRFLVRSLTPGGAPAPITIVATNEVFIGDPNTTQNVTGATFLEGGVPFNRLRIEIDRGLGAGFETIGETDLFDLAGKIIGLTITPPATGTDYGAVRLTPASVTKTFTVANISPNLVNIQVASSDPIDFTIPVNNCGQLTTGSSCTFDVSFSPATDGLKTTTITVSDQGATVPAATVTLTGSGDGIAPIVAITAPADASFTSDNTPLLTFSATDTNTVTNVVMVDNVIVSTVSGESLAQLADGSHTVTVDSTDAAGNVGSASATFTVDTVLPVVDITAPAAGLTNDNTPLLTFNVTDTNAVTNVVMVDNVVVTTLSGESLAQLADGPHTIRVESTDVAGNIAAPVEVIITVDATLPVVAITAPAAGHTNDNTPLLSFSVTDTNTVTNVVKVDNVVVTTVSGESLAQLADGQHTIRVESTDAAGNIAVPLEVIITVDTVLPVVGITAPAAGLTNDNTPLLTFSVTDTNAVTNVVKVDGVIVAKVSGDSLAQLADGPHTIRVESTDVAGNIAVPLEVIITVDTVVSPFTLNAVATPTRIATQNIGGTIEAGATVVVTTNTAATASAVVFSGTGATLNWTSTITGLVEGVNSITVTATDPAGNPASQQSGIKIVLPDGKITGAATVTLTDAFMALQFASGLIQPTPDEAIHGDVAPLVNGIPAPSGKIDTGDVMLILRKSVGLLNW